MNPKGAASGCALFGSLEMERADTRCGLSKGLGRTEPDVRSAIEMRRPEKRSENSGPDENIFQIGGRPRTAPEKALTINRITKTTSRILAILAASPASPKKPR